MYRKYAEAVEVMVEEGLPFSTVETRIEDMPLSTEQKSALWLYAWAEQPRETRRHVMHSVVC